MGANVLVAELTFESLKAKTAEEQRMIWKKYDDYAEASIPSLHMMNQVHPKRF